MTKEEAMKAIKEILDKAGDEFSVELRIVKQEPEEEDWREKAATHAAKIFAEVASEYFTDSVIDKITADFIPLYVESLEDVED